MNKQLIRHYLARAANLVVELPLRNQLIETVHFNGTRFRLSRNMNGIDYLALLRGAYEKQELAILRDHFQPTANIIEVGANIGIVSRTVYDEKLLDGGTMICVEPNPLAFPVLQQNLPNNGKKTLIFHRAAVAYTETASEEFRLRRNLSSGLSLHLSRNISDGEKIYVPVMLLSQLTEQLNGRFGFVCDSEGAEIGMVKNNPDAFSNCDQIMMEFHEPSLTGSEETPATMIERVKGTGFYLKAQAGNSCYFSRQP